MGGNGVGHKKHKNFRGAELSLPRAYRRNEVPAEAEEIFVLFVAKFRLHERGCPRAGSPRFSGGFNFGPIMAWRIDESVIRGELDNRVRDRVTGRIWFAGLDAPVEFELAGNAWRDLAGRRLEFVNPHSKAEALKGLAPRQMGVIGDCTASRKVKVPEVSMDELMERFERREPFPWHWGNSLYFEWFSTTNGRVVIESASYTLTISPDIAWDMTPEEEERQRRANGEAMGGFMARMGQAMAGKDVSSDAIEEASQDEWSEEKPQTEAEAEKMHADSERLVDRVQARMEREGPDADYEKILEEELERRRAERGEKRLTPEEEARRAEWMPEVNRASEEAGANPDPELEAELLRKHPLSERAFELSLRLMQEPEKRGWLPENAGEDHPLIDLGASAAKAGAKFAGALDGVSWPPDLDLCAGVLVRLKRARGYLDDALMAAEVCTQQKLGEPAWLHDVQRELNALGHACDLLGGELRARLG